MAREAAAYVRVSTKDQEESGFSIPAQKDLLSSYAAENRIRILEVFEESETAKLSGKRPAFARMIALLRARPQAVLLVEKTDRLYRNLRDYVTLEELGTEIHFVKERTVIGPNVHSSEKFLHGIKVLVAKNFSENLSEEIKKGMTKKASLGSFPSAAPLGYRNVVGAPGIVPDPAAGPLVRHLFERAATGFYSTAELTRLARSLGLRSKKGAVLNRNTVCTNILRNPAYHGTFRWAGTLYSGAYEPLVSKETFDQVQRVLDGRRNGGAPGHVFTFSGLLRCQTCGGLMSGMLKKGRYVYYSCQGRMGCRRFYPERLLDDEAVRVLEGIHIDRPVIDWLMAELEQTTAADPAADAEAAHARKRLSELRSLRDRAYEEKLLGRITEDYWREQSTRWQCEADDVAATLRRVEEAMPREAFLRAAREPMELAETAREEYLARPAAGRRQLLQAVVWNFTASESNLTASMRSPFDLLVEGAKTKEWWS
ncbi:recombinase family protein [Acidobacteria bacterium ACD]|nr:recombinase family protein [Acidobacteria bacterium ACB2]MDL1949658.1 recombinase family protein [Acidobacteria bacterium ACD]